MRRSATIGATDNGSTVVVDIADRVTVRLGSGWRTTTLRPLGGEPGPVTTPLQHAELTDAYLAVSAGRTAIRAEPVAGSDSAFEVTVVVRPRPGSKTHSGVR